MLQIFGNSDINLNILGNGVLQKTKLLFWTLSMVLVSFQQNTSTACPVSQNLYLKNSRWCTMSKTTVIFIEKIN